MIIQAWFYLYISSYSTKRFLVLVLYKKLYKITKIKYFYNKIKKIDKQLKTELIASY